MGSLILLLASISSAVSASKLNLNASAFESLGKIDSKVHGLFPQFVAMDAEADNADTEAKQEAIMDGIKELKTSISAIEERLDETANASTVKGIKSSIDKLEAQNQQSVSSLEKINESLDKVKSQTAEISKASQSILRLPKECADLRPSNPEDGMFRIYPYGTETSPAHVYCVFNLGGRNWTVIQRRFNGRLDFYRNWNEYKNGFSDATGEYWLGNDIIHQLTFSSKHMLRVVLHDFEGGSRYAQYNGFRIEEEAKEYKLRVWGYSGTAGDSLLIYHNGRSFSTFDRDNDKSTRGNCAASYRGAWWYNRCHISNLNGPYHHKPDCAFAMGLNWRTWRGFKYSHKATAMMIARA